MSNKPQLGTQLTLSQGLSPHLHQSIRLMHLSAVELQTHIEQILEDNPFLERTEVLEQPWDNTAVTASQNETVHQQSEHWLQDISRPETLQDYLLWQAELTPFSADERALAHLIIQAIDDEGYLSAPLKDILPDDIEDEYFELAYIVLHRIQQFDPPGVGAEDLKECLLIQLNQLEPQDERVVNAREAIEQGLDNLPPDILSLIQHLNPKPGNPFVNVENNYVVPDIIVHGENNHYRAYLNEAINPPLKLNQAYADALKQSQDKHALLKDKWQQAKSFFYHLSLRQQTLLSVAQTIVKIQQDFFKAGDAALKPLKLEDIAEATDLHVSTISRLTTNKFMHTPRGLFELKYFLSGSIKAEQGAVATRAVHALIAQWVAGEDKHQPLSDSALVDRLAEQGIHIARRTVAKYREALGIPARSLRKQSS